MKTLAKKHFILGSIATVLFATMSAANAAERSCLTGGEPKPVRIRAGASGFQNEEMTVVEGISGPELRIGASVIFLNPTIADNPQGPKISGDPTSNRWCVVDRELARSMRQNDPQKPICNNEPFGILRPDGRGQYEKQLTINGANGRPAVTITAKEVQGPDGIKRTELILSPAGSPDGRRENNIVLSGSVEGANDRHKVKLKIESRQIEAPGRVNGTLESEIDGTIPRSDSGQDPRAGTRFNTCQNPNQNRGQIRSSENKVSNNWMDISGNQITMRGTEVPVQDQFGVGEQRRAEKEETRSNVGRSGVS